MRPTGRDSLLYLIDKVNRYALLETPVTQELYALIMGENPSEFKGDELPVENVSRDQACEFCKKLKNRISSALCWDYLKFDVRLPKEKEWEYAAKAACFTERYCCDPKPSASRYPWGDVWEPGKANGAEGGPGRTTPVKSYPPNALGLYDMIGNVWEFCEDDYASDDPYSYSVDYYVARGGAWNSAPEECATDRYLKCSDYQKSSSLGFRVLIEFDAS